MSQQHVTFHGPHEPYSMPRKVNPKGTAFTVHDSDHTPWNKRSGQVEATAEMVIDQAPDWVSVRMEEITTYRDSGRVTSRVISMNMPRAVAEHVARHILTGPRDKGAK